MEIAKLTSKGQITIPKAVRMQLGVDTGDKLVFIKSENGYLVCNGDRFNSSVPEEVLEEQPVVRAAYAVPAPRRAARPVPAYDYDEEEEYVRTEKSEKKKDKDKDKDKDKKKKKKKKK